MATAHFSFILVNYHSAHLIRPWINSLRALLADLDKVEIIIVNNDNEEIDILNHLAQEFPIKIIHLPQNIGFGSAVNQGARVASGELLFLCNPDTLFLKGDFEQLRQYFRSQHDLGMVGLQLLDTQHQPELFAIGKVITLWQLIKNHLPLFHPYAPTKTCFIERVSGGALCIPRELFLQINGFDERYFLYFEDADLCQKVLVLKKKILFLPTIKIEHRGGVSMPSRKQQKKWYRQSRALYFHKHRPHYEQICLKLFSFLFERS
ncbi:MAG: glycosyltransferase family 2 protein [Candidatus Moraniibacteriota bacterium]